MFHPDEDDHRPLDEYDFDEPTARPRRRRFLLAAVALLLVVVLIATLVVTVNERPNPVPFLPTHRA